MVLYQTRYTKGRANLISTIISQINSFLSFLTSFFEIQPIANPIPRALRSRYRKGRSYRNIRY